MDKRATGAIVVVAMVAMAGLASAGEPPTPGRHGDHGRFTAQSEGFPPQPVDISSQVVVSPITNRAADQSLARATAAAQEDAEVASLLGTRWEMLGAWTQDQKEPRPGAQTVRFYAYDTDRTVVAVVDDGEVVEVEAVDADVWQPPLTGPERARSIEIARAHWIQEGQRRVEVLEGFSMHALDVDGAPFGVRMAYVTFHAHVDARPELLAWVDLTNQRVVRSRVELGPQPGAGTDQRQLVEPGQGPDTPRSGQIAWKQWRFAYDLSSRMDGVSLSNVSYQGVGVLARASMPAMTVFYDHPDGTAPQDTCGPFVDRLGPPELTPVPWAEDSDVVLREFTQYGTDWLEVGILDTLGNYVLYQSWYLSEDGEIDAHTFAKGLQCMFDHVHYPFWRFDFDLAGEADDQILRRTADGMVVEPVEFDADADDALDHGWQVRDAVTGDRVNLTFDDGSWNVPGEVLPEALYSTNRVYGRLLDRRETGEWRAPASEELGFNDGEPIDGADVVLWYRGFLPHSPEEGPDLWHSTGVRVDLDLAPRYYIRPGD